LLSVLFHAARSLGALAPIVLAAFKTVAVWSNSVTKLILAELIKIGVAKTPIVNADKIGQNNLLILLVLFIVFTSFGNNNKLLFHNILYQKTGPRIRHTYHLLFSF